MSTSLLLKPLFLLSLLLTTKCQDMYLEKVMAELEIATLELQDDCDNLANTLKSQLITNTFSERTKVLEAHGELLKSLSENLKPMEEDVPMEFLRNWTLLVKPGDGLLEEKDWSTLVKYDVSTDELIHTAAVHCKNGTQDCVLVKKGYDDILRSSKNQTLLKKGWLAWQTLLARQKREFPNVLNLVTKAALQNGKDSAKSYWEMLVEKEDSYELADELWDQIRPLYFKLQEFVKSRLFRFYNISNSDPEIPVYLLDSNFGYDWSHLASIVLPHPHLHYLAEAHINKTKIQNVYKLAEEMTHKLSLGTLGPKFWSNSLFNMSFCENRVVSFCVEEHSELFTCDKTTWVSYLDAFEVAMDVSLRNMDYLNLARTNLRYSVVDEAVKSLSSVLAVKNLRYNGIWDHSLFMNNGSELQVNDMTELLLIALRVLPQLPYYLSADKYRLHLLENGFHHMEEEWWKLRKQYQGVRGVFNNESDFLGDAYVASNKPYLSKFLGTILQFQFLEYYKPDWQNPNQSIAENIANDENFRTMLHERSTTEWPSLIVNYHGFYDLSATALLDFFAPLFTYLETAPLEQVVVTTTRKPSTTTKRVQAKGLNSATVKTVDKKAVEEDSEPPLPPKHEHVEENLEGPNPTMETISMYVGLALLVAVVVIIMFVVVSKKLKRIRTNNNRRFET